MAVPPSETTSLSIEFEPDRLGKLSLPLVKTEKVLGAQLERRSYVH